MGLDDFVDIQERHVEIVNCRLEAVGETPKPPMESTSAGEDGSHSRDTRKVHFGAGGGWLDAAIRNRASLAPGDQIVGPAVIEEMSSTTVVPPGYRANVDAIGNLVLEQNA